MHESITRWAPVPGYPDYVVGSNGVVISHLKSDRSKTARRLMPSLHYRGGRANKASVSIKMYRDTKMKRFLIHRVVMAAFIGPCPDGKEVNHIDGNPQNNALSNLEYITHTENTRHAVDTMDMNRGDKNGSCKLTADKVREIRARCLTGEKDASLAAEYGMTREHIGAIRRRRLWTWLA